MIRSSQSAAKKAKNKDRIVIGKIGAPHGVRGEMRVIPLTDFPERFQELEQVYVGEDLMQVEDCWYHKQFVIMKLKECPHREAAAELTGQLLYVDKSQAMPLEEGEYIKIILPMRQTTPPM